VEPGTLLGELTIEGRNLLVFICADFWFVDLLLRATRAPDLVLVPALSVTRKPSPDYSRSLWKHLAISRAYEFGTYVGISDWAHPSKLPILFTSGVGGFADPTTTDAERFFAPVGSSGVAVHELDFDALDAFRGDRVGRGFFWK
jgi:predicted amidohydrolase